MPILLADLVEDERLGLQLILAHQMDQPLSWVHVTEILDPSQWLSGGEMILTTGAGLHGRRERVRQFVHALKAAGVTALGWGFTADEIIVPPVMIGECQDAGLGLVAVPTSTPFIAVVQRFVEHIHAEREASMRLSITRNSEFIRALGTGDNSLTRLLQVVRDETGRDLWVRSSTGRVHAQAGRRSTAAVETPVSWIIDASRTPEVRLILDARDDDLTASEQTVVGEALPFLRFALAREDDAEKAERRLAAELIDVTLAGQSQFAAARLLAYGLDPKGLLVGAAVLAPRVEGLRARATLALARGGFDSIAAQYEGLTMMIVQPSIEPDVEQLAALLQRALGPRASVGFGATASGAEELRQSLLQAREAARYAHRLKRAWARHDEVDSHDLLIALHDHGTLETFRRNVLGAIIRHDERTGSELQHTLKAFVESGFHWQRTASELFIHVNTLRHRIARCEELTGRDLSDMRDRVDVYIALNLGP